MGRPVLLLLALALLLAGCGGTGAPHGSPGPSAGTPTASASSPPTNPPGHPAGPGADRARHAGPPQVLGTIAADLAVPWGIAFLPDGSALVTERDSGRVLHLTGSGTHWRATRVGTLDGHSVTGGESGLLGIAVSPTFTADHRVFFYLSTDDDNRVVRATYEDGRLAAPTPILTGIPLGTYHDGGRLAFGPRGNLFVSTGESGEPGLAGDPDSLGGKILRITQAGEPAPGNPGLDKPGGRPEVWTSGHRNVQGLAFTPDGRMWASEFGDHTWDELNLIVAGGNYGWPEVEGRGTDRRFRNPVAQWDTAQASPSGLAYAAGSLWLGALRGERLWRVPVHGARTGKPKAYFVGKYGRMRTVVRAPDGNLWVTTSNRDGRGDPAPHDDRILLVRP